MRNFFFRTGRSYLRKELQSRTCLWLHGHGLAKNMTKQKNGPRDLFLGSNKSDWGGRLGGVVSRWGGSVLSDWG